MGSIRTEGIRAARLRANKDDIKAHLVHGDSCTAIFRLMRLQNGSRSRTASANSQ
jgi:hypothetical protein